MTLNAGVWGVIAMVLCAAGGGEASGRPEGLPGALLAEVLSPQRLPRGRYVSAGVWEAESEMAHACGTAVADPEASSGYAWEARVGTSGPLHLLYGPYVELPPGDYVAFFRLKALEDGGGEAVLDLDASVSFGQKTLRSEEILGTDLPPGRYVQVPLAFHYPGGKLECRAYWRSYTSVRADRVSLYRLEGGPSLEQFGRAPQPIPSGLPRGLTLRPERRPFADIFPRSSLPAPDLLVVDLRREPPDWQHFALSIQGLVNRSRPRVYCLFNATDPQWLTWLQQRGWVRAWRSVGGPADLLARFRASVKGVVITDPALPASKNVATMIAGVREGVVVSPRIARQVRLPVLADLRGRWRRSLDAYRWAFDALWPRLNHHVVACSWPDHLGLRDYLVQQRVFIFWLPGVLDGAKPYAAPSEEVRLVERLLARMPANIPVMSYPWAGKDVGIGEGPGVTLFAEFGKYLVGSINCSNLSVHSGIRIPALRQRVPPPPRLDRRKVYVSFVISDGDNLPVLTVHNFPQLWKDPARGTLPIGWSISPSALSLIPAVADYYYRTATPNDCFLGAVSGVGYTYRDSYGRRYRRPAGDRVFDGFLDQTRVTMARMGLDSLWIMGATRPQRIARYAERIPFLRGLFPDYGRRVTDYAEATYPTARNVPTFHAATGWQEGVTREQQIAGFVSSARAMTPTERPAFLHLFVLNWFADLPMLREIARRLGPDYVVVRPDHLAALYRAEMARREVLVRIASPLAAVEGQELLLRAGLRNVSSRPLTLRVEVARGLRSALLRPAQSVLKPGAEAQLAIVGVPQGGPVVLRVRGASGAKTTRGVCRLVPRRELAAPIPGIGSLRFVRVYEAEHLAHRSGAQEPDRDAGGGLVWAARRGVAEPGYIVFGPYTPLDPGRYLVLFRLKRLGEGAGVLAALDTCVGGGHPVTATRQVPGDRLPAGEYRWFPLTFRHPGGAFEARVVWSGNAPMAVDSVALWGVEAPGASTRKAR